MALYRFTRSPSPGLYVRAEDWTAAFERLLREEPDAKAIELVRMPRVKGPALMAGRVLDA